MANIIEKLLDKLKKLLKKLLGNGDKKATKPSPGGAGVVGSTPPAKEPPKKPNEPETDNPYALVPSGQDSHGNTIYDPKKSNPDGKLKSILWKPKSDHAPHDPVVVVGCDDVRKEDLKLEILGKSGSVLKVGIRMSGRANGNRVHFRIDRAAEKFKKSAPIKLRFFQTVKGKKKIVQFKGKDTLTIQSPTRRKEV